MKLMPFLPEPGTVYSLPYGGKFKCLGITNRYQRNAMMVNILSGWTIEAHGIWRHEDDESAGCIEWDYSAGGHFDEQKDKEQT